MRIDVWLNLISLLTVIWFALLYSAWNWRVSGSLTYGQTYLTTWLHISPVGHRPWWNGPKSWDSISKMTRWKNPWHDWRKVRCSERNLHAKYISFLDITAIKHKCIALFSISVYSVLDNPVVWLSRHFWIGNRIWPLYYYWLVFILMAGYKRHTTVYTNIYYIYFHDTERLWLRLQDDMIASLVVFIKSRN